MTRVSVCIATFNGAKYIESQLDSILNQIGFEDEIIITDDNSTDETRKIIENYNDNRIKFFKNEIRLGHVQNFSRAISLASGEFIALSDQDDIWVESRLEKMLGILKNTNQFSLVIGDFREVNDQGEYVGTLAKLGKPMPKMWQQLFKIFAGKAKYFGCTFVFRSGLKKYILPIPLSIEAHDIWISMNACIHGNVFHCEDVTLLRRIHGGNLTPIRRRGFYKVIKSRLIYAVNLTLFLMK
jgi:glycosyltransferase involved in cell wall biosynthesis